MLTLTRKLDQNIVIIDQETGEVVATILVKEIRAHQIRLGIVAEQHFAILRGELHEANEQARHEDDGFVTVIGEIAS